MRTSLLGTLANKHKTRIAPIYRRLRTEVKDRGRTQTALVVTRERGEGKRPLVATFGGISLAWKRDVILSDRPPAVYGSGRSEIVQRLLAQRCEHCGSEDGSFEVHHVRRLADLDRPGRREVAAQVVEDEVRSAGPKRAGALPPVQRRAQTRAGQQGMSRDDAS